jgi:sugar/nucleoside kinase (ribokinase family)
VSLTVVGSLAFDSVKTPFAESERELGGSAVHAALAGALFTDARIVSPVGADFEKGHEAALVARGVDTSDLDRRTDAKTFEWRGRYEWDMSVAHHEATELNVFGDWRPELSAEARQTDILFLASMDPEMQIAVRNQWQGHKWSALDSIYFWIELKRDALIEAIRGVDIVLMNDQEVRALTGHRTLLNAARDIMAWGPTAVVIKHGEYGSSLLTRNGYFALPGYPLETIADPTGSGDAFAGGFLGYLDLVPAGAELNESVLRRAITYGSVVASFCVEDFGSRRILELTERQIDSRVADFKEMTHFEQVGTKQKRREPGGDPRRRGFGMPKPTAGTARYDEPEATGGTPSYGGAPSPGKGTPSYDPPRQTPGTTPLRKPKGPRDP